jgi:hypothetical protein
LHVKASLELTAVSAYIEAGEQSVVTTGGSTLEPAVQQVSERESGFDADEHPMSTHR